MTTSALAPHGNTPFRTTGPEITAAEGVLILSHGRGASADNILELVPFLEAPTLHVMAPAAADYTWYPFSFLAPIPDNEPGISSGIARLNALVEHALDNGIPENRIFVGGFSQGACLSSEFVARHTRDYGGLLAFSGGLIGPPETPRNYGGRLDGVPAFLGCSDRDAHVPAWRVEETAEILSRMGAKVDIRLYPNMPHTIIGDELKAARDLIAARLQS